MGTRSQKNAPVFAMALFALLLACILALVVLGGGLYGSLAGAQRQNGQVRASLTYLSTRVRAADCAGAVRLEDGPEGPALILAEPETGSGYETRIYLYEGRLLEDYAPAGSALAPQDAQAVAETCCFEPAWRAPSLLSSRTGEGTVLVALRSAEKEGLA